MTEGGLLSGQTKKSFQEYPELRNRETVFDSLVRSVTTGGWQLSNSNKEAGTISGVANVRNIVEDVRQFLGGEVTKLTLNVSVKMKEPGIIRVETALFIPAGTLLPDEDEKCVFWRILGSVAR